MTLLSEVKYETSIRELKEISPNSVLSMLRDVQADISRVYPSFVDADLTKVLAVIETGKYEVNGKDISICIDLSSAKSVIHAYRESSEGGCQSCVKLGRETIDAQDATSGLYCQESDPDYDANTIGDRPRVRYKGFSPKVRKYYDMPCNDWKPRFSPKLEELIGKEQ